MGKLIEDLKCSKPEKMHSKILEETTAHYKYTDGGVDSMCRAFEEYGNAIRRETTQKYEALLNIKEATISEKDAEIAFLKAELEKRMKEELAQ